MKKCTKCGETKPLSGFRNNSHSRDGKRPDCRDCSKQASKVYREKYPERVKESSRKWYEGDKERIIEQHRDYRARNKEQVFQLHKRYRENHPDKIKEHNDQWRADNADQHRRNARNWSKNNRPRVMVANGKRRGQSKLATPKWANLFFMAEAYALARLRTKVMGFKWHVDHIVPLRSKLVCGLHCEQNMRVIPAVQNLKKRNFTWPDMP